MTSGPSRGPRPPQREGGRPRFIPRRKVCAFCVDHATSVDYKSVERFGRYISDRGRIEPRRKTGTCAHHQRMLANAIKRARHVALLPFTQDHIRITGVMAPRPPMRREPYPRPPMPVAETNGEGAAEADVTLAASPADADVEQAPPPAEAAGEPEAVGTGAVEETTTP